MFDISWTEFLLIGVVALIVIGPKELPAVMRSLGQWTRKVRSMAADFQNQFHEAMREAEMTDLKKQVDDMASDIKNYDPLKDVRENVASIGTLGKEFNKDFEKSLDSTAAPKPVEVKPETSAAATLALPDSSAAAPEATGAATEPASPERTG
jgi:sec-independent protein translocase protein TatB